ncbi:hypothetical protein [Dyella terrae]|uniref:Thioredoxin domain-containing protein n=3 Tax=Dyella TaxID=231454 RepID=A0A4R0YSP8_9GAMM|nr:hypothetical protein [Dyella terrae]TBR40165.1 hypothetical protein EYV96_08355 [Dyella terrae]TCI12252.1 hypothetical protein EZM97_02515 [Dyella soli]
MRPWLCMLALTMPLLAHADPIKTLAANDVPSLVAPPAHGTRVLAFWALDCAYCESNLQALDRLHQQHPEVQVIAVATDSMTEAPTISARLKAAGVDHLPAYAYAEASPERINFLIDPKWGGETPRTLVIRADGTREGISGELTPQRLGTIARP